jgi:NAD(P)-dependent dehydrogenase (short-subunit alcohol dehydrogenase family)
MRDALDMSGKVVVVTGGSRGVGRGIAESFLEAGATVVICGRREPESPPSGAHLLVHGGGEKPAYLEAATKT